jgi:hypothetical protein
VRSVISLRNALSPLPTARFSHHPGARYISRVLPRWMIAMGVYSVSHSSRSKGGGHPRNSPLAATSNPSPNLGFFTAFPCDFLKYDARNLRSGSLSSLGSQPSPRGIHARSIISRRNVLPPPPTVITRALDIYLEFCHIAMVVYSVSHSSRSKGGGRGSDPTVPSDRPV